MRKSVLAILTTSVILASLLAPAFFAKTVMAADPTDWYMTVNGVLDSDYYSLYPYASKSVKLGLSKFGELIDSNTNVGLEYAGDRDPFAPVAGTTVPEQLGKHVWINGWYIDIRYNHSSWGYRNVWAGALFADIASYGGPWIRVDNGYGSCTHEWQEAFNLPGLPLDDLGNPVGTTLTNGGRKTNGTVITDPIQVLYNGPRLFVAKITNHIYDWQESGNVKRHVVDVVLTVLFNKVKKEVIMLKDVKIAEIAKFEVAPLRIKVNGTEVAVPMGYLVQFSNREEWDLGTVYSGTTSYSSYVHFWVEANEDGGYTSYDRAWTMLPTLPANVSIKGTTINKFGSMPYNGYGTYDLAQIISNDRKYVGWHAFWPSVSDWSVTAGDDITWFRALYAGDPHTVDGYAEPWRSPLVVGEWDFMLSDQERHIPVPGTDLVVDCNVQFRGVSVYGVTDLHDGKDETFADYNNVDREVLYQLDEVFDPYDLFWALHKDTFRWVEFFEGDGETHEFWLNNWWTTDSSFRWYAWDSYWGSYFSEKVLVDGQLIWPWDALIWEGKWVYWPSFPYCYIIDEEGYVTFWRDYDGDKATYGFTPWAPPEGASIKVLYSTWYTWNQIPWGRYEWVIVGRDAHTVDSAGAAMVAAAFKDKLLEYYWYGYGELSEDSVGPAARNQIGPAQMWPGGAEIGLAGADMYNPSMTDQMPWVMHKFGTGNTKADYKDSLYRAALRDDWCHAGTVEYDEWPVASSNMIGVGGPLANLLAYYGNDFTQAIFGLNEFTDYPAWEEAIIPLTCWDITKTQAYRSNATVGYAVISTYLDINGTVLFLIWGHWGRDTFYVTQWFKEWGIWQLQEAPPGLTSIIVKIDYESTGEGYKPKGFSIVECLGTISERLWIHWDEPKGGIHDP